MIAALEEFHQLSGDVLHSLAAGLRSGRLSPPYSALVLHFYCPGETCFGVATRMQQLYSDGLSSVHLGLLLESIAEARERESIGKAIDLVWSGPEGVGVTNRDTGTVVRELFLSAYEQVLLAGYAVYQGQEVFRTLATRMEELPGLQVHMFLDVKRKHSDTSPDKLILREFGKRFREVEWPGSRLPEVFYDPRSLSLDPGKRSSLHAKCVVIDKQTAFVSSANFTEAAQERNIEAGVLIRSESFASSLANHFETLAAQRILLPLTLQG